MGDVLLIAFLQGLVMICYEAYCVLFSDLDLDFWLNFWPESRLNSQTLKINNTNIIPWFIY